MVQIKAVTARQILDSRGQPTVETTVILENGIKATASVPSGASTGIHEAVELRDNRAESFGGKSVSLAVENVRGILNKLLTGLDSTDQQGIDRKMIELDGTPNKKNIGANAILSVSAAVLKASAAAEGKEVYQRISDLYGGKKTEHQVIPLFNVVNGGLHGNNRLSIQEFMVITAPGLSFSRALETGAAIYQTMRKDLAQRQIPLAVGDEGGFIPDASDNSQVISYLLEIIRQAGYKYGIDVFLGLDFASSTYFKDGYYSFTADTLSSAREYLTEIENLQRQYRFHLLEDPLSEDDWQNWSVLTEKIGSQTKIVGDDLLVTNSQRLEKAVREKSCNAILIKINQIGTISETLEVMHLADKHGFSRIISHRSGETNDDLIADLAVGTGAQYVKFGAPARGERTAKYNRLLAIYDQYS